MISFIPDYNYNKEFDLKYNNASCLFINSNGRRNWILGRKKLESLFFSWTNVNFELGLILLTFNFNAISCEVNSLLKGKICGLVLIVKHNSVFVSPIPLVYVCLSLILCTLFFALFSQLFL